MRFTVFLLLWSASLVLSAPPQVQLGTTTLIGRDVTLLQQDFFGGIPFAEPPVGKLRLKAPVLKRSLEAGTFDASSFGLACLQPDLSREEISEDCLTINVFRPSGVSVNASLPVMFWTYGGGFFQGSSSQSVYNASALVAQSVQRGTPIIYVSFNYRLGPLGFPQGREAARRNALNLGLKDHIVALEWVQENIHVFGGDKDKVTIFGESAGAVMSAILLLNPSVSRLARAGIFESGSAATIFVRPAYDREDDWQHFVSGVAGCEDLSETFDCVRNASESEVLNGLLYALAAADELFPFIPTLDGPRGLFPDYPSVLFKKGMLAPLPFIAGTNRDEGSYMASLESDFSEATMRARFIANYTPPAIPDAILDELFEQYPEVPALGSPYGTGNETFGLPAGYKRLASLIGDLMFDSQRRLLTETSAKANTKVFGYLFDQFVSQYPPLLGVVHSIEVQFVYGSDSLLTESASARALSAMMMDYWISFATSLDPNDGLGSTRPLWPQYMSNNPVLMQLDGDNMTTIADDYRKEAIEFISDNAVAFHH